MKSTGTVIICILFDAVFIRKHVLLLLLSIFQVHFKASRELRNGPPHHDLLLRKWFEMPMFGVFTMSEWSLNFNYNFHWKQNTSKNITSTIQLPFPFWSVWRVFVLLSTSVFSPCIAKTRSDLQGLFAKRLTSCRKEQGFDFLLIWSVSSPEDECSDLS